MNNPYSNFDEYGFRHWPAHLIGAELWDDLEKSLTELDFIEAICAAGMATELVQHFQAARLFIVTGSDTGKRFSEFADFARGEAHHLRLFAAHPGYVLQTALNSASYPYVVEAAKQYRKTNEPACILLLRKQRPQPYQGKQPSATLIGHKQPVASVAISLSGKRVFSSGYSDATYPTSTAPRKCLQSYVTSGLPW